MNSSKQTCVLAIAIDSAEPTLIRRLIDQGELPALAALEREGSWLTVHSSSYLGSASVWPTFATGTEPKVHGVYAEWCWQPETMNVKRFDGDFAPFWKLFAARGVSVGVIDPPFAKPIGLSDGFEVIDWGAHDSVRQGMQVFPAEIRQQILREIGPHPVFTNRHDNASPHDPKELRKLAAKCLHGVKLRGRLARTLIDTTDPDFTFVVFTELHHCGHYLWHATQLRNSLDVDFGQTKPATPSVEDLCREIDRQVAILSQTRGPEDAIIVFSLHGMRHSAGVPSFLSDLLCEKQFACMAHWASQSWTHRSRSLLATLKRRAPERLKKLYYRVLSLRAVKAVAQPTMLPEYDWRHTRAFSLPTDQHGWIRINLRNRERDGIVAPEEYEPTCAEVENFMRSLQTVDGAPLVKSVIRMAANVAEAELIKLPDLVVHWTDAAFLNGAKIKDSNVRIKMIGTKFTGQHALDGFCIAKGPIDPGAAAIVKAQEMHQMFSSLLFNEKWRPAVQERSAGERA
jgi:predicted AlkP superfamily phosphohydrolase/phosphomutase